METRFLESFILVAEKGSIAEAARTQNLTAAALAQRIRALEDEIGSPLIVRAGRTVRPTEAGVAIIEKSRALLQEIRDLNAMASLEEISGELRLGVLASLTTGLLPDTLKSLTDAHPKIDVSMRSGLSIELYERFSNSELDAIFTAAPPFELPKSMDMLVIRDERLNIVVPNSFREEDIFALLSYRPFIQYDRRCWEGRMIDDYLKIIDIRPRIQFEVDSYEAAIALVGEGLGITIAPSLDPDMLERLQVRLFPVPLQAVRHKVALLWARTSPRLILVKALLAVLKNRPDPQQAP